MPSHGANDRALLADPRADAGADREQRRECSARGAAPEVHRPRDELERDEREQRAPHDLPREQIGDVLVADAERARRDHADDADDDRAERWPPHPVNVKALAELLEGVLDAVAEARDPDGAHADDESEQRIRDERQPRGLRKRRDREDRSRAAERRAHARRDRRRERDRNERAWAIFEQQELHRQQHGAHRAAEGGGHPGRGSRSEQRLSLIRRDVKDLSGQRAKRAAGRDDRSLRAERTARADRDRGRNRLEKEHARGNAALAVQDALHHLRNSMPANRRGAVARHQPDDDRAANGDRDDEPRIVRAESRRGEVGGEPAEERRVGHESDEADQQLRGECGADRHDDGAGADADRAAIDGRVLPRRTKRRGAITRICYRIFQPRGDGNRARIDG